ncbi:MAG: hypothetical protein E7472_07645 [Ruminococcaceae bacterium]|nr:hypothetical protein [Oscillospiraceae bacterium]
MAAGFQKKRAQRERFLQATQELFLLRDDLTEAYRVFNSTSDPALLEASILEIGALQSKYSCMLRNIKAMNGELQHGKIHHRAGNHPSADRRRTHRAADQAAEKTSEMGV